MSSGGDLCLWNHMYCIPPGLRSINVLSFISYFYVYGVSKGIHEWSTMFASLCSSIGIDVICGFVEWHLHKPFYSTIYYYITIEDY